MTHLKIELSEGYIEYVADSVVEKLYESVTNSTLDNESNLLGTVHVNSAFRYHVEHLLTRFPNFHINSTNYILEFLDPRAYDFFTNVINNGVPMTELRFTSLTSLEIGRDLFEPITDATFRYLPELKLCKSITYLHRLNGINVYMVDLSNIETVNTINLFGRAILSKKIWLTATKITNIGVAMHLDGGTEDGSIVLPENLQVYDGLYVSYSNINKLYFRTQTPPTFKGDLTDRVTYYVPVGTGLAYQDAIINKSGSAWDSSLYTVVEYDYETDELDLLSPFVYPETVTY